MSKQEDYWIEAVDEALDCANVKATKAQLKDIAKAIEMAHECYGMAFYSPPSSDRVSSVEREWKAKFEALQSEFDRYRNGAEKAVRVALRQRGDEPVSIQSDGSVLRHGGRTEQIQ